jgi:hypothetical protein
MRTINVSENTFDCLVKIGKYFEKKYGESVKKSVKDCPDQYYANAAPDWLLGYVSVHDDDAHKIVFTNEIKVNGRWVKKDGPEKDQKKEDEKELGFI